MTTIRATCPSCGDVRLKGGSGSVTLKSVEGIIEAEGPKGRITLSSVNEEIVLRDAAGAVHCLDKVANCAGVCRQRQRSLHGAPPRGSAATSCCRRLAP